MKRHIYALIVLCLLPVGALHAQSGLSFQDWKNRLEPYFAEELISDIAREMPRGANYKVWGWDVGDYSGDGHNDCALSIFVSGERRRHVEVFFFVDIDGYLINVGRTEVPFIDLPIEAGISISDNACYVTRKREQLNWDVLGYRFDNGSLIVLDEFSTTKLSKYTHESYRNYQSLYSFEKYLGTRTGQVEEMVEYLSIPSYARGRYVYKGFAAEAQSNSIRFVQQGSYYWMDENDASFTVRSAYNEEHLYFIVNVRDDAVVTESHIHEAWDQVEVWLDVVNNPDRHLRSRRNEDFIAVADSGIYSFLIKPGNFADRRPEVLVSATDVMSEVQNLALQDIRVVSTPTDTGYKVKLRIPFVLLGYSAAPIDPEQITEFGCTVVVRDVDNGFRPKEESWIATSCFDKLNPASYGALLLMPDSRGYGQARNIYVDAFAERLNELGF